MQPMQYRKTNVASPISKLHTNTRLLSLAQWGTMTSEGTLETIIAQQHKNKPVEYFSSNYKGRVYVTSKASLSFMDVKVDDTGRYGCKLTFGDATISNSTILEVSGRRLFFSLS